jgi:tripartite ATP-independent transporter DctM subunit
MSALGLGLLALAGVMLIFTGLPAFAVLIFAATVGAVLALAAGEITLGLLGGALTARLVNLLENDLLQALPLFVLMGVLLNRMEVVPAVFRTLAWLLPRRPGGPVVAGLGLGALLAPMSGSVGASVLALCRSVEPMLAGHGVAPEVRQAAVAVAATLGVVVPPSLVLILLGDAMLTAHTIAVNATGRPDRIVNTQDVLRAAILPAGLLVLLTLPIGWWGGNRGRDSGSDAAAPVGRQAPTWDELLVTIAAVTFLLVLLGGVAAGRFFAVEAAAAGAVTLFTAGLLTRRICGRTLGAMLSEVLATTGALFAPLLAATTFTLVLRLIGTDRLIERWVTGLPGGTTAVTLAVLAALFLAGFVLDAFEIIFVAVPILIPPLLMRVPDAVWVAALVLLALQASFLLPPVGYALMMTRGSLKSVVPMGAMVRALGPFLAAQVCVLALVLTVPGLVHVLEPANARSRGVETAPGKPEPPPMQVPPLPFSIGPPPAAAPPPFEPPGSVQGVR